MERTGRRQLQGRKGNGCGGCLDTVDLGPISNKTGYLYANSANTTLTFSGTLAGTVAATPLVYVSQATLKGFNLIDNMTGEDVDLLASKLVAEPIVRMGKSVL
ncbi:MAG: hypothetical protein J6P83_01255 [Bacteroidales bacterium]|nr:hypothetical protein [Bacteroidales bacterium]